MGKDVDDCVVEDKLIGFGFSSLFRFLAPPLLLPLLLVLVRVAAGETTTTAAVVSSSSDHTDTHA